MTRLLTDNQRIALAMINTVPNKSGGFYADFGHKATTLSSLFNRGLIQSDSHPIIGRSIHRAAWALTDAGRAALEAEDHG